MQQEQTIVLSNGVRLLIEELPYVHSASIGFWVDTGSRAEDAETNGICHFIEHMLFKGTRHRTALDIAQSLEVSGGSLNAFTDKEHTCFHARVLASEVPLALDVLADMLLNSLIDPAELRREKAVVIEEIKMYEDAPDELVHDILMETFWSGHSLGRPITGTKRSVRGLDRDMVQSFLRDYYTPDRLVISVVGQVDREAVVERLERAFIDFNRPGQPRDDLPPVGQSRAVVKYRDVEQAHLCVGLPGVAANDERRYTLALLNCILGGGMSSRLFQEVREKRGLVYSIGTYEALYRQGGMFTVSAGMSPKHLSTVLSLIWEELAKAQGGDVGEEEMERAKRTLKGSLLLSLEVPRHRMSRMAQNELYFGRQIHPDEVIAAIERVTPLELAELATSLFDSGRAATTVVGPLRKMPLPGGGT